MYFTAYTICIVLNLCVQKFLYVEMNYFNALLAYLSIVDLVGSVILLTYFFLRENYIFAGIALVANLSNIVVQGVAGRKLWCNL